MWMKHKEFVELVQNSWQSQRTSVVEKIRKLNGILKNWNKDKFGNIFHNKRRLLAMINGIQNCLSKRPSQYLSTLEETLVKEYQDILEQEEIFWQQKSRNYIGELKSEAVSYFFKLFEEKHIVDMYSQLPLLFPKLNEMDLDCLSSTVSEQDIKHSLFNIGGIKAPELDGFPAIFFQKFLNSC
ncbi:hypothetical protein Dsin_032431 [Dipteronia sinensis]|uniref:Uncharacterized protein n=1 Tax=Dipteronia sinensis TaxID=43782 RepID=A0AAD9ZPD0_9ROSI|nr:hypothetical protein Dsin_032431 [Dipteronia sinensis]